MALDRSLIGRVQPGGTLTVTRSRLRDFARATGQTDPVYWDAEAAVRAGHPDVPAPPTFVFSAEFEGTDPFAFLTALGVDLRTVLHGEQEFRYHAMVHAGDELTVSGRIADIYERKGGALEFVVRESVVTNQHGTVVAEMRGTTIIRHPEASPAHPADRRAGDRRHDHRPEPGHDELPPLDIPPITRATLALFAGASGDHNPIHIDLDVARSAGHDDVFAHGMLSMAYLARLLTDNVPQERIRSYRVRFTAITPVHAQPTCTGTVASIDEVDGERRATLELRVTLADGTVTLLGEAVVAPVGS